MHETLKKKYLRQCSKCFNCYKTSLKYSKICFPCFVLNEENINGKENSAARINHRLKQEQGVLL